MMKKMITAVSIPRSFILLVLILALCIIPAVSCSGGAQAPTGALPVLHTWDNWAERVSVGGKTYTAVTRVTGTETYNGVDCYKALTTFNPPLPMYSEMPELTFSSVKLWIDKTTLRTIGGEAQGSMSGVYFTLTINSSKDYSNKPYPLSVGKTWTLVSESTATILIMGQSEVVTEQESSNYKVEGLETVTVPAGTFNCFKIVKYNGSTNDIESIEWVTDVTGGYAVKTVDNLMGLTSELTSYYVAE